MREIWLDESLPTAENGLIYIGNPQSKFGYGTFGTISTDTRGMSTEGYDSNKIKELLNAIKEKDNELNRVVNQLKSQLDSKTKKTYTSITSPGKEKTIDSITSLYKKTEKIEKFDKYDKSNDYETKQICMT